MTELIPRIAIFKATLPLQIHTINLALSFQKAGFGVDVFLFEIEAQSYQELDVFYNANNIRVFSFNEQTHKKSYQKEYMGPVKTQKKGYWYFSNLIQTFKFSMNYILYWMKFDFGFIPNRILDKTIKILTASHYRCLIGVEKKGLVWAGIISKKTNIPIMYYNLELFTWDDPYTLQSVRMKRLKQLEDKYHKHCIGTIIQDKRRASVLFSDNKTPWHRVFFLPVSLAGGIEKNKSSYFQDKFNLNHRQSILLYVGLIHPSRYCYELVDISQTFSSDLVVIFHSVPNDTATDELPNLQNRNKFQKSLFSLERVASSELGSVISSAHMGLVLYKNKTINDTLTGFSSEKLTYYLKCGIPIIAFNYPSYEYIEQEKCGVLIHDISEIEYAANKILASYDDYRKNAFNCFEKYFQFETNVQPIINFINKLE